VECTNENFGKPGVASADAEIGDSHLDQRSVGTLGNSRPAAIATTRTSFGAV